MLLRILPHDLLTKLLQRLLILLLPHRFLRLVGGHSEASAAGDGHFFEVVGVVAAAEEGEAADLVVEGWLGGPAAEEVLGLLEALVVEGLSAVGAILRAAEG